MSLLSFARDQRVILAGLGIVSVSLVAVITSLLTSLRDESEIKPPQLKTQYITQDTEDSLKLGTLDTLLAHYNFAIRETSAKIVCDRAVNDGSTIDVLLWGITRPDYDERMQNLRCLAIITDHQSLHLLHNRKAYTALVRSLELCLLDSDGDGESKREKLDDKYYDEYFLRDMSEKLCLMFVSQLISRYEADELVKAGFVEKWLARQNWGETEEEIKKNFGQYIATKQNRITEIIRRVRCSNVGLEALVAAKLMSALPRVDDDDSETMMAIILTTGPRITEDREEQRTGATGEQLVPRVLGQSAEEQRLRHRHREAMVFNDGTRPLNRGDIIERNHESAD